jgi:hypothetical protein
MFLSNLAQLYRSGLQSVDWLISNFRVHSQRRNGCALFFLVNLPARPPGLMPAMDAGEDRVRPFHRIAADRAVSAIMQLHQTFNQFIFSHFISPCSLFVHFIYGQYRQVQAVELAQNAHQSRLVYDGPGKDHLAVFQQLHLASLNSS